jgi:hypothetical protein
MYNEEPNYGTETVIRWYLYMGFSATRVFSFHFNVLTPLSSGYLHESMVSKFEAGR